MAFPIMSTAATAAAVYGSVAGGGGGGEDRGVLGDPQAEGLFDRMAKLMTSKAAPAYMNKAIAYNPWDSATPYDPSDSPYKPSVALDSAKSAISDLAKSQWKNLVEAALNSRETEGTFETVDVENIADAAVQMALEQAPLGWKDVYDRVYDDVDAHFDSAEGRVPSLLTSIKNLIANSVRDDMVTEIGDAKTWARTTGIQALSDGNAQASADAVGNLTTGNLNAKIGLTTIMTNAGTAATTAVSSALSAALSEAALAANSDLVSDSVDAYEARSNNAYMRNVSQFAGGMRDIGAVNSSAFIFGLSNMAAERQHDLAKYDADLSAQMYHEAMAIAGTVFTHSFDRYYGLYMGKLDHYFKQLAVGQPEYMRTFLVGLAERLQTYRSIIPSYLQADTNLVGQHTNMSTNLTGAFLQDFKNYFESYVQASMATELQTGNNKDAFLLSAVTDQFNMLQSRSQGYRDLTLLEQEMNRIYNAEQRVYKEDGLAYADRDAKWALEILKYPQNLLGAASGGTTSPESVPIGRQVLGTTISFVANQLAMRENPPNPNNTGRAGGSGGLGFNIQTPAQQQLNLNP